jgi:hypothetical protein
MHGRVPPADWRGPDRPARVETVPVIERSRSRGAGLRRLLGIVASLLFVAGVVVGRIVAPPESTVPRDEAGRPPSASAEAVPSGPGPTLRPAAAPLPVLLVNGAPAPEGRIIVAADGGFRTLDLGTGELGGFVGTWRDVLHVHPDGGYVCACVERPWGDRTESILVRAVRMTSDGTVTWTGEPRQYTGRRPQPDAVSSAAGLGSALTPDGRTLLLGWAIRVAEGWSFGLDLVPVERSGPERRVPLGVIEPSGSPLRAGDPMVRVSADGRLAVVTGWLGVRGPAGWAVERPRWLVLLEPPDAGPVSTFGGENDPTAACDSGGFAGPAVYVSVCRSTVPSEEGLTLVGIHDAPGPSGEGALTVVMPAGPQPVVRIDAGSGSIFVWDPLGHVIARIDARTGRVSATTAIAPADRDAQGELPVAPLARPLGSDALALSPDGARLYALGRPRPDRTGGSSGVWVFDARTLARLDHWEPTADLVALTVSRDGRWVYAVGAWGADAEGRPSRQDSSLTVYDAATGEVRLIAGRPGGSLVSVVAPG